MSYPLVRPYITYEELSRLPSDGHRYEFFDGEAYVSPSPSLWHQDVLVNLLLAFRAAAQGVARVYIAPADVVLGPATVPQPDLVMVLNEHASILSDVIRGAPDLVLEVLSPSTAAVDRGLKMETYARHGIPEYWIADGERQAIEVYRLDRAAGAYRLMATYRRGDRATTPLLPDQGALRQEARSTSGSGRGDGGGVQIRARGLQETPPLADQPGHVGRIDFGIRH